MITVDRCHDTVLELLQNSKILTLLIHQTKFQGIIFLVLLILEAIWCVLGHV